jgi:N,N'-diacetyllegionaminate synthase
MTSPWETQGRSPYIIAEIGVNHDGSVGRALDLVDAAAHADANAVKLQLFETDLLMSKAAQLAAYQKSAGERDPFAMLSQLELSIEDMATIVDRAHEHQLDAIVSVFSVDLVATAERLPWDAYKTASPDIIHKPLLDALAATGKPIIVSTGASTMEEVLCANDWLNNASDRIAFLQCVSSYPTPIEETALGGIVALARVLEAPVGYSDHTDECDAGAWAVEMGAMILEKHLTYDRSAVGPDHRASLDPTQFARYVKRARAAALAPVTTTGSSQTTSIPKAALGPIAKHVSDIEYDVRRASRQSLVAVRDLSPGDRIQAHDLTIKRPGVGVEPWRLEEVIGMTLARVVEADMPVVEDDLE